MFSKYFNLILIFTFADLVLISKTDNWYNSYCEDSLCLYFNGTNVQANSNDEANKYCSKSGLMLLEIPNSRVQEIVDKATASWDNSFRPLIGFYFKLNLVQVVDEQWKWISTNQPLDSTVTTSSKKNFGIVQINSSGIYYSSDFERFKYPSICSCNGTCKNSGSCSIRDNESNSCIVVVSTAANWFDSRSNCQYMGGDLATVIKSPPPQWISNVPAGSYWFGLTKAKYVWSSTGKIADYFKWYDGDPIESHDCTCISHPDYRSPNYFRSTPCNGGAKPFICMNGTGSYNQTFISLTSPQFTTSSSSVPMPASSSSSSTIQSFISTSTTTNTKTATDGKDPSSTTGSPLSIGIIAGVATSAILLAMLVVIVLFFVFRYVKKNKNSTYENTIDELEKTAPNDYDTEISEGHSGVVGGPYDNPNAGTINKYDEIEDPTIYDEFNETSPYDKVLEEKDSTYHHDINALPSSYGMISQRTSNDKFSHLGKASLIRNSNCLSYFPSSTDTNYSIPKETRDIPSERIVLETLEDMRLTC